MTEAIIIGDIAGQYDALMRLLTILILFFFIFTHLTAGSLLYIIN